MEQKDTRTIQAELPLPSLRRIWSGGFSRPIKKASGAWRFLLSPIGPSRPDWMKW